MGKTSLIKKVMSEIRIKKVLLEKEIIVIRKDGVYLSDSMFELWFKQKMM